MYFELGDVMTCAGGFVVEQMEAYQGQLEGEISTIMGLSRSLTLELVEKAQNS